MSRRLRIFEAKVLIVTLTFGVLNGFHDITISHLPLILHEAGYTSLEVSLGLALINGLYFIIYPVLLFITLYFAAGKNLFEKVSSTLISLILGSILGYWSGLISASMMLINIGAYRAPFEGISGLISAYLYRGSVVQMIIGLAALTLPSINDRWRMLLSKVNGGMRRPIGVLVLSLLYIILGMVSLCILPFLAFFPMAVQLLFRRPLFGFCLVSLIILNAAAQILIGVGLYRGEKWGWALSLISAMFSLLNYVTQLASHRYIADPFMLVILIGIIMLDLAILFYLFQPYTREYFGIVNPSGEAH